MGRGSGSKGKHPKGAGNPGGDEPVDVSLETNPRHYTFVGKAVPAHGESAGAAKQTKGGGKTHGKDGGKTPGKASATPGGPTPDDAQVKGGKAHGKDSGKIQKGCGKSPGKDGPVAKGTGKSPGKDPVANKGTGKAAGKDGGPKCTGKAPGKDGSPVAKGTGKAPQDGSPGANSAAGKGADGSLAKGTGKAPGKTPGKDAGKTRGKDGGGGKSPGKGASKDAGKGNKGETTKGVGKQQSKDAGKPGAADKGKGSGNDQDVHTPVRTTMQESPNTGTPPSKPTGTKVTEPEKPKPTKGAKGAAATAVEATASPSEEPGKGSGTTVASKGKGAQQGAKKFALSGPKDIPLQQRKALNEKLRRFAFLKAFLLDKDLATIVVEPYYEEWLGCQAGKKHPQFDDDNWKLYKVFKSISTFATTTSGKGSNKGAGNKRKKELSMEEKEEKEFQKDLQALRDLSDKAVNVAAGLGKSGIAKQEGLIAQLGSISKACDRIQQMIFASKPFAECLEWLLYYKDSDLKEYQRQVVDAEVILQSHERKAAEKRKREKAAEEEKKKQQKPAEDEAEEFQDDDEENEEMNDGECEEEWPEDDGQEAAEEAPAAKRRRPTRSARHFIGTSSFMKMLMASGAASCNIIFYYHMKSLVPFMTLATLDWASNLRVLCNAGANGSGNDDAVAVEKGWGTDLRFLRRRLRDYSRQSMCPFCEALAWTYVHGDDAGNSAEFLYTAFGRGILPDIMHLAHLAIFPDVFISVHQRQGPKEAFYDQNVETIGS
ncbi:hypothetical protein AK812_SmicGene16316 [Symbiodinium microadriaticum]|uniref:Uncharacterized protein n=1 Tax=Symbiodinium microadriaticum TaxID=2951 RepID=A0A1Q9E0M7_SYMMI|nr:hypothetical protein AK812_SmicGene16316 [Symbiodinium microadriaticum]